LETLRQRLTHRGTEIDERSFERRHAEPLPNDDVARREVGPVEHDAGQSGADAVDHCQVDEPVEHLTGLDSHGRLMAERSGRHGGQRGCREHLEGLGSG